MEGYTVGLTTYNCEAQAREFINTFEIKDRHIELIVIDAGSTDGTRTVFQQYDGQVRTETIKGCTRGEGRQRAVELARHDHIISEVDPDIRFRGLEAVIDTYEQDVEDNTALLVRGNNGLLVAPTTLLERYPYRPLQYREDHALHDKLYKADAIAVLGPPPTVEVQDGRRVETVRLPTGDVFVASETVRDMTPVERLADWYSDVQAMYRIGFAAKQIFEHNIRSMTPLQIAGTLPLTGLGIVAADSPRYSDALAHCSDELYLPLRHECYSAEIMVDKTRSEQAGDFS